MASAAVTTDTGLNLSASYTYEDDLLTKIQTASTTYNFTYGNFGLRTSVDIGERNLATYSYTQDGNNYLSSLDYGNGDKVQYEYDNLGRVTKQTYEDGDTVAYQYDNSGALATVTDSATGRKTTYYYDFTDRLMKYVETGSNYYHSVGYEYDQLNNLTSLVETINGTDYTTSYSYDDDNRISSVTTDEAIKIYSYDDYGRSYQQRTTDSNSSLMRLDTFTFKNPSETTTSPQIIGHTIASQQFSKSYSYTYDDNGNILSVNDGTYTTSYLYDSANQLIRENNEQLGFTYVWAYDSAGNILSRTEYAYTPGSLTDVTPVDMITYTYGNSEWGDLLTAYDGQTISYDEIGNPLSDGTRSYTWEHGRELSSLTQNNVTWNYTYDSNGMRTSRTNGTKTYQYVYNGSQLMQMSVDGYTFSFTYDASGTPQTISLNGYTYYYVTNIQGDVVGILNEDGAEVVRYGYDAWGNVEILCDDDPISAHNPLLYRGYIYDFETGLYYLQSRYYDPALGRFINADGLVSTGQGVLGNNMFAYCGNNPVNMYDPNGRCTRFLGFLWKIDCHDASCPESENYKPDAPKVVVIYDGRFSGYFGYFHDNGFEHQGKELVERLSSTNIVESYSYITVEDFVNCWNELDGTYDAIYIVGHGLKGELRFKGGESIANQNGTYCFSDLDAVAVDTLYLYSCNGATTDTYGGSVAGYLSTLTGASVYAVKDGKLDFTWYGCYPKPQNGGYWVTIE